MKERIGLLVMDYGTPTAEADLMPYYTSIRRGYAPTEAEVAVLKKRYEAIGGLSPLGALTEGQAELLAKQLNEHSDDVSYELYIGHKHMPPFIEDAVTAMGEAGITKAVAIVMAPYFSLFATASYLNEPNDGRLVIKWKFGKWRPGMKNRSSWPIGIRRWKRRWRKP